MLYSKDDRGSRLDITQFNDEWVALSLRNALVSRLLRDYIEENKRRFDLKANKWLVHFTQLGNLVSTLQRHFDSIVWRTLPPTWQKLAAGGSSTDGVKPRALYKKYDPYKELYVDPNAPFFVIKAAYQALVHAYHPDQNEGIGNPDKLSDVMYAWKIIVKKEQNNS